MVLALYLQDHLDTIPMVAASVLEATQATQGVFPNLAD
jgi:hypothetical protein